MCIGLFNPKIFTCASNFLGRFPQLKCSLRIKLTFGSYDFSFKMKMNSKSKRFSYLGKLNTRERLSSIARTRWRAAAASQLHRRTRYRAAAASHTLATCSEHILRDVTSDQYFAEIFNTTHYSIIRHRKGHCIRFRMIPLSTREGVGQKSYGSLSKAFVFVANMRPWSRKECDRPSHKCDNGLDRVNLRNIKFAS